MIRLFQRVRHGTQGTPKQVGHGRNTTGNSVSAGLSTRVSFLLPLAFNAFVIPTPIKVTLPKERIRDFGGHETFKMNLDGFGVFLQEFRNFLCLVVNLKSIQKGLYIFIRFIEGRGVGFNIFFSSRNLILSRGYRTRGSVTSFNDLSVIIQDCSISCFTTDGSTRFASSAGNDLIGFIGNAQSEFLQIRTNGSPHDDDIYDMTMMMVYERLYERI
mmetsp:Transcript_18152/g.30089  ORF Transcript_18152/g.30089 Transcript_18152/m.30089 type:complete len:215 (-) Transcript_18152:200-844(-)